ncbi:hypothetical protein ACA081_00615 [Candidatus Hodgkinia cicadicola]
MIIALNTAARSANELLFSNVIIIFTNKRLMGLKVMLVKKGDRFQIIRGIDEFISSGMKT